MRLVLCAVSALALSGCTWLGGLTGSSHQEQSSYAQKGQYGAYQSDVGYDPCQVYTAQSAVPQGCNPAAVTVATSQYGATNGFPQQPQFGQTSYTTGGYGSYAGSAAQQGANYQPQGPHLRKPRFRGSLSLGAEKSFQGDVLDYRTFPTDPQTGLSTNPALNYNPQAYNESRIEGSVADGQTVQTTYTAGARDRFGNTQYDEARVPTLSFDDAWSTPARIAIGGEYILSNKNTVFVQGGYSVSEGKSGVVGTVEATLYEDVTTTNYDQTTGAQIGPSVTQTTFIPNEDIAKFSADFTDMKRYDLEVGARHYFNPVNKTGGLNTVTPFVGASVGASHYNAVSYKTDQQQRFYEQAFNNPDGEDTQFYDLDGQERTVNLYDSQWVASGQLNAGVEWQLTPKVGLAFETGLRFEGARKYANDEKGDTNIAVPLTIRGSYNF